MTAGPLFDSSTPRDRRCEDRLENLGVRPGVSLRRLLSVLRKQEGRPIKISQRGQHGRLLHMRAEVSAVVVRTAPGSIPIWLPENPHRSMRGRRVLLHELSHLIVRPCDRLDVVSRPAVAADVLPAEYLPAGLTDPSMTPVQLRCDVDDEEERDVEWTAGLLQHYMAPWVQQRELPPASGVGLFIARRGGGDEGGRP
jgi:hypothetical protein